MPVTTQRLTFPPAGKRSGNILLNRLDDAAWRAVQPHLTRRALHTGQVIFEAADQVDALWFPEGGVASVHEVRAGGGRVGVGIAGFEGCVGWSVLLGSKVSLHEVTVALGESTALCMASSKLTSLCSAQGSLNRLLLSYVQSFFAQMSGTILSNLHEPTERRLARWLLMNHDRLEGDEIALTHEQLGVMLGVRRASVTDTLHVLEGLGLVRSVRGRVIIRNRSGLVAFAGESYGAAESEYTRAIAPFSRELCGSREPISA